MNRIRRKGSKTPIAHGSGDDHVAIAAGTLDQPTGLRTVAQIYVADAGDYYTIADGLKRILERPARRSMSSGA